MKLPRNAKIFRGQLDAAPFAAVAFLLLIFLLLSSRLVVTPGVRIDLPEVSYSVPGTTNLPLVVAVDLAGQFYYEGERVSEEDLFGRLKAAVKRSKEPLALEIQMDRSGKLDRAMRLWAMVGEVGFKEAIIVTRPPLRPIQSGRPSPK